MAHSIRRAGTTSAAIALLLLGAGSALAGKKNPNRSAVSVHQPIVDRTDYVLDISASPNGLNQGEADRLIGWFDGLNLGYGDTITLDDPLGSHSARAQEAVAAIVSRYGMLISHDTAPITVGHATAGGLRVVVSRAFAHVEGCPDWSHANNEYQGGNASNYGCAAAINLAAMLANPQDLVEGRASHQPSDATLSVKAIKTYRDAVTTGTQGLKDESTKSSGGNQ